MPRKKREISETDKLQEDLRKRQHKLDSIKTDFEAGRTTSFEQIFAVMVESRLAAELHMGFATFRNKVNHPGEFSINELRQLAELFQLDVSVILQFIFNLIAAKENQTQTNT